VLVVDREVVVADLDGDDLAGMRQADMDPLTADSSGQASPASAPP
jgi:hypothetical protein